MFAYVMLLAGLAFASGQITPAQNFNPVTITVNAAPFDVISTPITPVAPYSQAAYQCNLTGDSRYPPFASGTYPLTVRVPVGQRVRVIFANGNLNGATSTQTGEPGVIVQQGGSPIVQQAGGASPIVQKVGSPIVQQTNAAPAVMQPMTGPTVVQQQPSYPQSPIVQQPPSTPSSPIVQQPPATTPARTPATPIVQQGTPAATPAATPATPIVQQSTPAATPARTPATPIVQQGTPASTPATPIVQQSTPAATPAATPARTPAAATVVQQSTPAAATVVQQSTPAAATVVQQSTPAAATVVQQGRHLLQNTVPGGPNNGLVEYVAQISANTVPGFVVPNTQFGVPYVEFTSSAAAAGQTASFKGALTVATVVGGVPLYPFQRSASQSPDCQVNVNFVVA